MDGLPKRNDILITQDSSETFRCEHFNFHPLEVVSRYRNPQLQVGENGLVKGVVKLDVLSLG